MRILEIIRHLFSSNPEKVEGLANILSERFGIYEFLYATTEGLPITGNFESYEEMAAKAPELIKTLTEVHPSPIFSIVTGQDTVYILAKITGDVLLFARGSAILDANEMDDLIRITREELGI